MVDLSTHAHQIDDTAEGVFFSDRQLNSDRISLQTIFHHLDSISEISSDNIHLVDESNTRNIVNIGLTPYIFGLGLNAAAGTEYGYRTVQNTQRTLNLNGEINVAGSIDNVDTVALPKTGSCGGGNGNTTLLLLGHPVHLSGTVVSFTDFMSFAGIEQNSFSQSSFTGIDMGHDTDITRICQRIFSRH